MTEAEITETEVTEAEEHVENPVAVLRKNRELLCDLKAAKERAGQLEELARNLGLDDADLADPKAHIAKRAESAKAAEHRARLVREAVLTKIISEQRTVTGPVEDLVAKALADPAVTLDGDKVTGLDAALRDAPKRPTPGLPTVAGLKARPEAAPASFGELLQRGPDAVKLFSQRSPAVYQSLKADFERKLAKPERRG